jgi:hypothetical protein
MASIAYEDERHTDGLAGGAVKGRGLIMAAITHRAWAAHQRLGRLRLGQQGTDAAAQLANERVVSRHPDEEKKE